MIRRPQRSTLFPSTTLSRSPQFPAGHGRLDLAPLLGRQAAVVQRDRQVALVQPPQLLERELRLPARVDEDQDRKSTRLNSSHANISYAVFCLKKKKKTLLHT